MNPSRFAYLTQLSLLTRQTVYLVGGSVRDLLIGIDDIKDFDILIPHDSEAVARTLADKIDGSFFFLDQERKITRVMKRTPDGENLQFDFTDYTGKDLSSDLARRDFTVNAMALDLRDFLKDHSLEGTVDLFEGKKDIARKIIRVVKPQVLDDDPLRLLRAVRFSASLGFSIEGSTRAHIESRAVHVTDPAPERIRDEFFQILSLRGGEEHLKLMDSLRLLPFLLPELEPLAGFKPGGYHIYDVKTHSIMAAGYLDAVLDDFKKLSPGYFERTLRHLDEQLESLIPRRAALRFACLLHDIAKPETFSLDDEGHVHFYGHDNIGAEKAKGVCRRFRLSRDTEKIVSTLIKQHMRLFNLSRPGGPTRNALYRYCRDMKDALPESLILAQADARATYQVMPRERFMDTEKPMAAVLEYYYEQYLKTEAKPLIAGNDLIESGFKPGPRFRVILEEIKERQAAGLLRDRNEALEYLNTLKE